MAGRFVRRSKLFRNHAFLRLRTRHSLREGEQRLGVEHLEERCLLAADFGDAPPPFPTTLADDGARHEAIGPILGVLRDAEDDSAITLDPTTSDDAVADDDEDGVAFGVLRVGMTTAQATVTVASAPDGAYLNAWIDLDRDGTWGGVWEQIVSDVFVHEGENTLTFVIPGTAASGETFARFRLSSAAGLTPRGAAIDGEVEDYAVVIAPPAASSGEFGLPHVVATEIAATSLADAADVDGDGDMDLVATSPDGGVWWHENRGEFGFAPHVVIAGVDDLRHVSVADLDHDGDVDFVTAAAGDDYGLAWHENLGQQYFVTHVIADLNEESHSLHVADADLDGDLDILMGLAETVDCFQNDGTESFTPKFVGEFLRASSIQAADVDGDGRVDVLASGQGGRDVVLFHGGPDGYEREVLYTASGTWISSALGHVNTWPGLDVAFSSRSDSMIRSSYPSLTSFVANHASGYGLLSLVDLNGDGFADPLYSRSSVAWLQISGEGAGDGPHRLQTDGLSGRPLPVDMDGDGDLDLIVALAADQTIAWHENSQARVIFVSESSSQVAENDAAAFSDKHYRRYGPVNKALAVHFTLGGSAIADVDYRLWGATLTSSTGGYFEFSPGSEHAKVRVAAIDDDFYELDEAVEIQIQDGPGYVVTTAEPRTAWIVDDDPGDLGDAPAPYPTLRSDGGARHGAFGPKLGASRDAEADGWQSSGATGDDAVGADDEDGVTWSPLRVGQKTATATIEATEIYGDAYVNVWLDSNRDGNWGAASEHVVANYLVSPGRQQIEFAVPAGAVSGVTYARVRISSQPGLGPEGAAIDGEVEDYEIVIEPPDPGAAEFVVHRVAPNDEDYPQSVATADFDGDGDLDIVAGWVWFENRGDGAYWRSEIDDAPQESSVYVAVADVDSDGDMDFVAHSGLMETGRDVYWCENDGAGNFALHFVDRIGGSGVTPVDIDNDGDIDLLGSWKIYLNDGHETFSQQEWSYLGGDSYLQTLQAIDIDRDGDLDLFANRPDGGLVGWYENFGQARFGFRRADFANADEMQVVDVDGDGDLDFVATGAGRDNLSWIENDGALNYEPHLISRPDTKSGRYLSVADWDGDGDPDVVASGDDDKSLMLYVNDGTGVFSTRDLVRFVDHVKDVQAADADGDGDLDLISVQSSLPTGEGRIAWHENVSGVVNVAASAPQTAENHGAPVEFVFTRTGVLAAPLTVALGVAGDAQLGADYEAEGGESLTATGGTVVFPAGVAEARVLVTPLDDAALESNETIQIAVAAGSDYKVGDDFTAVTWLVDDEPGDFGDAPAPYPTMLIDNGPRHGASGPTLGARRDEESDGAPSDAANADDELGGLNDEDGVVFPQLHVGQLDALAVVRVGNAPAGALLSAWIDFNADGVWTGRDEQIAADVSVVAGDNVLRFSVPATAVSGPAFARIRISTDGGLGPAGSSSDGEVEDYRIVIEPPRVASVEFDPALAIGEGSRYGTVDAADFDGDGDLDLVVDGPLEDRLSWYENLGVGEFARHEVSDLPAGATRVFAIDIDSDGDEDIISAVNSGVLIYYNDGWGSFSVSLDESPVFLFVGVVRDLEFADFDHDGDLDMIVAAGVTSQSGLSWLENVGAGRFEHRVLDLQTVSSLAAADFDQDGDVDIAAASGSELVIYDNQGDGRLTRTVVADYYAGYLGLIAADYDGDGLQDVVYATNRDRRIMWLRNRGVDGFEENIASVGSHIHAAADMDGDGDVELLTSRSSTAGMSVLFYSDTWWREARTIDGLAENVLSMTPGDFDGDGDIDVVALVPQGYGNAQLQLYLNKPFVVSADFFRDGRVDGRDFLTWQRGASDGSSGQFNGDANGDRKADGADLLIWQSTYGPSSTTAVVGDSEQRIAVSPAAMAVLQTQQVARVGAQSSAAAAVAQFESGLFLARPAYFVAARGPAIDGVVSARRHSSPSAASSTDKPYQQVRVDAPSQHREAPGRRSFEPRKSLKEVQLAASGKFRLASPDTGARSEFAANSLETQLSLDEVFASYEGRQRFAFW
ncbi:MAG: hypothetical protein CMJ58_11390 [Planctomycetaceae bacterium]|nr:hypothetical protein [Planctomycetaceae bacterium]